MALISDAALTVVVDKLSRWVSTAVGDSGFDDAFNAGMDAANAAVMSGAGSLFDYLISVADTDGDAVADLLSPARDLDETNPVPPTRFLFSIAGISAFLTDLNNHIKRYNPATTTLDAYLTSLNLATPTLRVHQAFADHLKSMSRGNVFVGVDTVLATFTVSGATTGSYAHVAALPTTVAGSKIVVKNQGANTTGATLSVTGKKLDGTTAVLTATVSTGTDDFETDLSVTTKLFYDVTAISITGGTSTDVYEIVALSDRDISAA